MKLALVISSLRGGGAERVMATLANAWAAHGASVTLITLAPESSDAYPLDPAVVRVGLNKAGRSRSLLHALANNWSRILAVRKAIVASRADAVISFIAETNLLTLIATTGLQIPVIVSERIFVGAMAPRGIRRKLHGPLYRRATAVVAPAQRAANHVEAAFGCRVAVIPNPVSFPSESQGFPDHAPRGIRHEGHTLLAVGRLVHQKGFDLLIEAFAQVAGRHPGWHLRILGEGGARAELARAVTSKGLQDRISMPGFVADVRGEMLRADLFVLSSRFEGFPNVLLEALSQGLPCVSFDCETGPGELIEHARNGLLVPANDVSALAGALDAAMRDAGLRERLGTRGREASRIYSLPAILEQWNALLKSVVFQPSRRKNEHHLQDTLRQSAGEADMPRVLFLARSLKQGGAERQLVALASGLHQHGWPVTVACFYGGGTFQKELESAGVPMIDLRKRGRWDVAGFLWRLLRSFREADADIVHSYLTMANVLALLAPLVSRRTRVVWGVRSSFIDRDGRDWLSRFSFRLSCKLARMAKSIIVNSEAGAAHHIALGYPESRMMVIPNGIDTERFKFDPAGRERLRASWRLPDDSMLVGLVGRIDPMKDHLTFIRMSALLLERDPRWRFACIGRESPGESKYAQTLRTEAESLGLGDRLIWAGPQEDMPAVYSALDIVVSTSCGEGFSNAIAEAMACGRPCVVTTVGDSAAIVGDTGMAVPVGDPGALCDAVVRMRQRLLIQGQTVAAGARARIVERFGTANLIARTEAAMYALDRGLRREGGLPTS